MKLIFLLHFFYLLHAYSWQDYKAQFHKTYSNDSDDSIHQAAFNASIAYINQINSQNLSYKLAPTKWSDRPSSEISQIVKISVSNDSLTPKTSLSKTSQYTGLTGVKVSTANSLDWRTSNKVTPVRDQQSCGCCWAFSTAAATQSLFLINNNTNLTASTQYLLECTSNSSCDGGYVDFAMRVVIQTGLPPQLKYPYTSGGGTENSTSGICTKDSSFYMLPSDTTTQTYKNLTNSEMITLASKAPFVALISADTGFMNYGTGIYSCNFTATQLDLNHAITIIGYDSKGNYLIKNSWGNSWGDGGFGWINGNSSSNCGINLYVYQISSNTYTTSNGSTTTTTTTTKPLGESAVIICWVLIVGILLC